MFDIGWGELVVIGIIALIAIGPKELPTVLRTAGQWMGKIRRMASEFQGQFQEALREAEMADLKKQADELKSAVTDATSFDPLSEIRSDVEKEFENPKAVEADNPPAATAEPAALPAPAEPSPPPTPATEKDFVPAEPPSKTAGGKA
jgi:sec-independent protein translocase protein TatB